MKSVNRGIWLRKFGFGLFDGGVEEKFLFPRGWMEIYPCAIIGVPSSNDVDT